MRPLTTVLRRAFGALIALVVLFEEWGWEPLQRLMARIARLPGLRQLEEAIARLPAWAALIVLVLPSLLLVPVKLAALWLIGAGKSSLGVTVIVVAKIVGTAIVARLFTLTRPALARLTWFEVVYRRWVAWKEIVVARVRASWAWRAGRVLKRAAVRQWTRWRVVRPG
jgi:hypothetical protein